MQRIMKNKKRFIIAMLALLLLVFLSIFFRNQQSELPIFINLLLGGFTFYLLLDYLVRSGKLGFENANKKKRYWWFGISMFLLTLGVFWANTADDGSHDSFWVVNHNIWMADVLAAVMAMLVFYMLFVWSFEQWKGIQNLKNEKIKAELALLKTQVNPHFFFNTLNNLYSLIKKDPDKAQEYVLKLSDMMRFTIYDGNADTVALQEEIHYLNNFIDLQTARYHRKVDIQFAHTIENNNTAIPALMLIILVENAFKHGVEKVVEEAFVHIHLMENEKEVVFKIRNNYDPEEKAEHSGIGLQNLQGRLNLLYPGEMHQLTIDNQNSEYSVTLELKKP